MHANQAEAAALVKAQRISIVIGGNDPKASASPLQCPGRRALADEPSVPSWAGDAPRLLVKTAMRLEPIEGGLSRATYLDALESNRPQATAARLASDGL